MTLAYNLDAAARVYPCDISSAHNACFVAWRAKDAPLLAILRSELAELEARFAAQVSR